MHHPPPSFMSKDLQACTTPSLLPCGRRGTARAVEDRELAISLEYLAYSHPSLHCPANQLRATLRCCANHPDPPAITHHYRCPPLSEKEGFPSLHYSANQLRSTFLRTKKSHLFAEVGFLILGFRYLHTVIHCCNCSGNYLVNATATY